MFLLCYIHQCFYFIVFFYYFVSFLVSHNQFNFTIEIQIIKIKLSRICAKAFLIIQSIFWLTFSIFLTFTTKIVLIISNNALWFYKNDTVIILGSIIWEFGYLVCLFLIDSWQIIKSFKLYGNNFNYLLSWFRFSMIQEFEPA